MKALAEWGIPEFEGAVGESVGQVLQYARTGAVDVAFVSRAQVLDVDAAEVRTVSADVAGPLPQAALLLQEGRDVEEARRFLDFLRGPVAGELIRAGGYTLPDDHG
jgi:molybdate transport system substrate-binding protein